MSVFQQEFYIKKMETYGIHMINNTIRTAEYQLNQHKTLGKKSNLSIFQVAELIDSIERAKRFESQPKKEMLFFNYTRN